MWPTPSNVQSDCMSSTSPDGEKYTRTRNFRQLPNNWKQEQPVPVIEWRETPSSANFSVTAQSRWRRELMCFTCSLNRTCTRTGQSHSVRLARQPLPFSFSLISFGAGADPFHWLLCRFFPINWQNVKWATKGDVTSACVRGVSNVCLQTSVHL